MYNSLPKFTRTRRGVSRCPFCLSPASATINSSLSPYSLQLQG